MVLQRPFFFSFTLFFFPPYFYLFKNASANKKTKHQLNASLSFHQTREVTLSLLRCRWCGVREEKTEVKVETHRRKKREEKKHLKKRKRFFSTRKKFVDERNGKHHVHRWLRNPKRKKNMETSQKVSFDYPRAFWKNQNGKKQEEKTKIKRETKGRT